MDELARKIAKMLRGCGYVPDADSSERGVAHIIAQELSPVRELMEAAEQYICDTAGDQEDEEELARALGQFAPFSCKRLRRAIEAVKKGTR